METVNDKNLEIKRQMFSHAMKGKWEEVVEIYKKNAEVHVAKITKSGDTALHLAVSDGQDEFVKQLVDTIYKADSKAKAAAPSVQTEGGSGGQASSGENKPGGGGEEEKAPKALRIKNERGNTPLHLAAASGSLEMCYWIANKHPNLIFIRNKHQMNPLFLAALNGKKDAFLCLDNFCRNKRPLLEYCRGSNGDTFLHAALNGEYFDLTFQIICRYGELVNQNNEKGFTPLHVLATKPSSFKSGKRLGRLDGIIYHCTFVEELKEDKGKKEPKPKSKPEEQPNLPENYQTCFFIYGLYRKVVRVIYPEKKTNGKSKGTGNNNTPQKTDVESPVHSHDIFPPNYKSCFEPVKLIYKAILIILGCGSRDIKKVQDKKKQNVWTIQILNKLLSLSMTYGYEDNGQKPQDHVSELPILEDNTNSGTLATAQNPAGANKNNQKNEGQTKEQTDDPQKNKAPILVVGKDRIIEVVEQVVEQLLIDQTKNDDQHKNETPILVAAKYGIIEIVEKVLEQFPVAIHDTNSDEKNIVLLAVENRQTNVYEFLLERNILKDSIFSKVDKDGNSAVHLAAKIGEYRPWLIPGAALQMQWEIKWYEFVKYSMPLHFFVHYNKADETPKDIFTKSHKDLVKQGGEWLNTTSNSCSVVAALIATVAFATASTVPGGNSTEGKPTLENQPAFNVFAITSLVALCFSVTALIMFLAILTSRHQERDFRSSLPGKLLVGLNSLFVSITAMLVSFCAGHFFVLKDELKFVAFPVYAVTCLPVTFFAISQFPLYFDLIRAMFKNVPQRSYRLVAQ
ncbi:Ankyrin repeat-containing protein ITN1 [Camellia lanceoleosa]|uniref:Ankyrin repeat-containing protein ITN1 n=1 Tax=Camellia lanceoleosa TaxID=1840588 RepID=A0ACC0F540_9ERIC|nr:Ankyrin repeat-containing protein ITN1 [Camellia lanceoleosa]